MHNMKDVGKKVDSESKLLLLKTKKKRRRNKVVDMIVGTSRIGKGNMFSDHFCIKMCPNLARRKCCWMISFASWKLRFNIIKGIAE
ncbi:hypothetical protein MKW92_000424, partial [Papaver armeniacum]